MSVIDKHAVMVHFEFWVVNVMMYNVIEFHVRERAIFEIWSYLISFINMLRVILVLMSVCTELERLLRREKLFDNILLFLNSNRNEPASDCTPEHNAGFSRPPWLHHEQCNLKGHDLIFEKDISTQVFYFFILQ